MADKVNLAPANLPSGPDAAACEEQERQQSVKPERHRGAELAQLLWLEKARSSASALTSTPVSARSSPASYCTRAGFSITGVSRRAND